MNSSAIHDNRVTMSSNNRYRVTEVRGKSVNRGKPWDDNEIDIFKTEYGLSSMVAMKRDTRGKRDAEIGKAKLLLKIFNL